MTATTNTTAGKAGSLTTVELDHPITRGETEIRSVQLRKPKADTRGADDLDDYDYGEDEEDEDYEFEAEDETDAGEDEEK